MHDPNEPLQSPRPRWRTRILWGTVSGLLSASVVGGIWVGLWLLFDDDSPLPTEWNPLHPLVIDAPVTSLTSAKLARAIADPMLCREVLGASADFMVLPDLTPEEDCGIPNRIRLSRVGQAVVAPVETQCATALRLAMWEAHGVRSAAEALGDRVTRITHFSSYSCRPIRTTRGSGPRLSTHAQAAAIDVSGVTLASGQRVSLLANWTGDDAKAQFLRTARDAACQWFGTVLGPEYNSLHADHFHLQNRGWGTCR